MTRRLFVLAPLLAALVLAPPATPQDRKKADKSASHESALAVAQGVVDKADKDTLWIRPRSANGQFLKAVGLRVTGTSKVAVLAPQTRGGKTIFTQRDGDAKELNSGDAVAVIYAEAGADGPVLLSAVVHPAGGK